MPEGKQTEQPPGPLVLLKSHGNKGVTQHTAATGTLRTETEWTDMHTDLGRCAVPASVAIVGPWPAAHAWAEDSPTVRSSS